MGYFLDQVVTPRRRRGRKQTVTLKKSAPAFITRNVPTYELLNDASLQLVEDRADRLLDEVGMDFRDDPEVLDIWKQAGARVEGERVRFEPGMLRSIIKASAPKEFTQVARNAEHSVVMGGKNAIFAPAYGPPYIRSLDFERRYATIEDFQNLVKLA